MYFVGKVGDKYENSDCFLCELGIFFGRPCESN